MRWLMKNSHLLTQLGLFAYAIHWYLADNPFKAMTLLLMVLVIRSFKDQKWV